MSSSPYCGLCDIVIRNLKIVSLIVTPTPLISSHRDPVSAGTYRGNCATQDAHCCIAVIPHHIFIKHNLKKFIQEEIKSRLKLRNACYYSVQNLLSSSLLSKKLKIKKYRTIILPVALYGCETWPLKLREERRLRVFENRVLRRVFGPKRDEVTGEWRKLHN